MPGCLARGPLTTVHLLGKQLQSDARLSSKTPPGPLTTVCTYLVSGFRAMAGCLARGSLTTVHLPGKLLKIDARLYSKRISSQLAIRKPLTTVHLQYLARDCRATPGCLARSGCRGTPVVKQEDLSQKLTYSTRQTAA
jgi:hypothetical protein